MTDSHPKTPARPVPKFPFTTPGNAGSTATSQGLESCKQEDRRPLIWQDILLFKLGNLERYLYRMFQTVGAISSGGPLRPGDDVIREGLQGCLNEIDKVVKKNENEASMAVIDEAFKKYANTTGETERYQHFVSGANEILSLLEGVVIGARKPSASDKKLQFMVHDPRTIPIAHNGQKSNRKPDVVLSYQKFVDPLYPVKKDAMRHLEEAPPTYLSWEKGLMFLEFKKSKKVLDPPTPWKDPRVGSEKNHAYETEEDLKSQLDPQAPVATESVATAAPQPSQSSKTRRSASQSTNKGKGSRKRAAPDTVEGASASKKAKTSEVKQGEAPAAAAQLGEYAAEALHDAFGRSHVLGFLVKDSNINIWHFDHESPLQLTGFDFLKNRHYLFLFLFAIQRFDDKDWGYLPGFGELVGNNVKTLDLKDAWVDNPNAEARPFTGTDMIKPRYGLNGRATGVLYGSVKVAGTPTDVAVKLSWPEKSRPREKAFIDKAREEFSAPEFATDNPCDYLPTILAAKEYPEFESGPLRQAVLQNEEEYLPMRLASRIPYLIVMPKYEPISKLTRNWIVFLAAFCALFYCHAMLWSVGIRHGDISETNLMWDPATEKPKLCDFDLSHFCDKPKLDVEEEGPNGPTGFSNTGTWIFMASALLTEAAMAGEVKRVYRHEVEAFIAVLVWIVCRYQGGKLRDHPPLGQWSQTIYELCQTKRQRTFDKIMDDKMGMPSGIPGEVWEVVKETLHSLSNLVDQARIAHRDRARIARNPSYGEHHSKFNDVCALHKILSWPLFEHPAASRSVELLRSRILNVSKGEAMV